jgi:hypothetical protein
MAIFRRLKKPNPQKEQDLREQIEAEGGLEKNDVLAMIVAATVVILPVALIALGVMALLMFLFL